MNYLNVEFMAVYACVRFHSSQHLLFNTEVHLQTFNVMTEHLTLYRLKKTMVLSKMVQFIKESDSSPCSQHNEYS